MLSRKFFVKFFLAGLFISFVFAYSFEAFSQRSRARSSSSSRSSARSSSSSRSSARSSTSSSNSSRNSTRSSGTSREAVSLTSTTNTSSNSSSNTSSNTVSNPCEIARVLQNDGGQYAYLKGKYCNQPSNTVLKSWSESVNDTYNKYSWIDSTKAVYFICGDGFVQVDDECVSTDLICPLNVIITRPSSNKYVNPETGQNCSIPKGGAASKVSEAELMDQGLAYDVDEATKPVCLNNYFSAPISGSSNHFQCVKCPNNGKTEKAGATSVKDCSTYSEVQGNPEWENYGMTSVGGGVSSTSTSSSSASPSNNCKSGTYLSGTTCKECPDYQWSDDGATSCSPIKFQFFRSNHSSSKGCYNIVSKWVEASTKTLQCTAQAFGDSSSASKNCGGPCDHMTPQGGTINFSNCKKLPCVISNGKSPTGGGYEIYFINEKGIMHKWHTSNPTNITVKTEKVVDW